MQKPLTVARQEFTEKLVNDVEQAGLPAFVIREVLATIDRRLAEIEQQQYANDKQAWEESQKEVEHVEGEVVDGDSE